MTYYIAGFALFLIWDMSSRGEFLTTGEIVWKGALWTVTILFWHTVAYLLRRK